MSVYTKLNEARTVFQTLPLKKTGENNFAGYKYFELGDFLPQALSLFNKIGLCAIVSFDDKTATMTIVDTDDGSQIVITSPMGSAALKGCHDVQNIGAVETYQRRYLWVTALEIVEHDALDSVTGKKPAEPTPAEIFDQYAESIEATTDMVALQKVWTAAARWAKAYPDYLASLTNIKERQKAELGAAA